MNTCHACQNDLVCHDQGECLRPTPETDAEELHEPYLVNELPFCVVRIDFARRLERQRNEARELLASEKSTRNAIIAKGTEMERQLAEARQAFAIATDQLVQVQGELRQAREENARLRAELQNIANAKPSEWGDMSDQFQPWAQNRARHALLTT